MTSIINKIHLIRNTIPETKLIDSQVSHEEGEFIHWIALATKACKILEIGSCVGYSAAWLAYALHISYGNSGQLLTIEKSPKRAELAKINLDSLELSCDITVLNADALDLLPTMQNASFDLIFIDANKLAYEKYFDYADRIIKNGGVIIIDDASLFSQNIENNRTKKMQQSINKAIKAAFEKKCYTVSMLQIYHGLLLCYKNIENKLV